MPMLLIAFFITFFAPARAALAQVSVDIPADFAGFSSQALPTTIGNLVGVFVGFLGIILILIILAGGLKWMTSGGNEDRIAEAKKMIGAGVTGLLLILMAYSIAGFLVNNLAGAL
ncbi:MAG: hypothetical protein HY422_01995 [Candidatus Komeilibacteria bacterium]|nr:hypothetical protein [Candidatus Komeilibacteria bacterium]